MIKTRKQFGQHWLKSEKALNSIITAAEIQSSDRVLEIGPGTGVLTWELLQIAQAVTCVEVDRDLCELLTKRFSKFERFLLLQGDFLTLDWREALTHFPTFQHPNKVVANIPYNITGPILENLLGTISKPNPEPFDSIVLLVQKEVALRLCARAGSTHYGALSVRVQYVADCEFICDVTAQAFEPPPKVDSAVIRLKPKSIESPAESPKRMETLIKVGFMSKRKMLRNNLKSLMEIEPLNSLLESLEINPQARAEDLSVREWINLSDRFTMPVTQTQPPRSKGSIDPVEPEDLQ